MTRFAVSIFALAVVACQPQGTPETHVDKTAVDPASPVETASPEIERDPAVVLRKWGDALESGDWETAYLTWGEVGRVSGMSRDEFAASYEEYDTINVELGEGVSEGAAGSIFYTADVTMSGKLKSGGDYRLVGPVTMRRVNDVPGASVELLKWHIESSELKPRPVE